MKKALLCGAAAVSLALLSTGPTTAADPNDGYRPPWTGFYFGIDLGYGDSNVDGRFNPSELPGDPWDDDGGFVGGGHIGYDWQMDSFLIGLEGDVMATGLASDACNDCVNGSEQASAETDILASIRARLGMIVNDTNLLYATGGVAFRDGQWTASGSGLAGADDFDEVGGVIGAGWENRVSENISVRAEVLYYMFSTINAPPDCCNTIGSDFDSDPFVFRLGASWRL